MSIKWMSYIWEERPDLKGSELYCAIAIADHADDGGYCFPGIKTIAQKMRLKERQVQDLIKRLEAKNVFTVDRGNGRGNMTSFIFQRVQDSAERVQDSARKGAGFCVERVQDSASPYKEESSCESSVTAAAAESETSPTAADIFASAFGVQLNNFARTRIALITDLTAWRDFINDRLMIDSDKPQHYRNAMPKWILKAFGEWKEQQPVPEYTSIYEQIKANAPQQAIYDAERAIRNAELKKQTAELMRSGQLNQSNSRTQNQRCN